MTVIACRAGVMAADTAVWQGSLMVGHTRKIHRLRNGSLFGGSGYRPVIQACLAWLNNEGERPEPVEDGEFGALILGLDGLLRVDCRFRQYDSSVGDFAAEGAHTEFMVGAMMAGASAELAVQLAIHVGDNAGGEVQVERL